MIHRQERKARAGALQCTVHCSGARSGNESQKVHKLEGGSYMEPVKTWSHCPQSVKWMFSEEEKK